MSGGTLHRDLQVLAQLPAQLLPELEQDRVGRIGQRNRVWKVDILLRTTDADVGVVVKRNWSLGLRSPAAENAEPRRVGGCRVEGDGRRDIRERSG